MIDKQLFTAYLFFWLFWHIISFSSVDDLVHITPNIEYDSR